MNTMLACKRVRVFQSAIREAYHNEYSTHLEILATVRERVTSTREYHTLPRWAQSEIRGYETSVREDMHRRLTWVTLEWQGTRHFKWDDIPADGKEYLTSTPPDQVKADALQYHIWTRTGVAFNRGKVAK